MKKGDHTNSKKNIYAVLVAFLLAFFSVSWALGAPPWKNTNTSLVVEASCVDGKPQAETSWSAVKGAYKYTLHRNPLNTSWSILKENILLTSYTDTNFPKGSGVYQYQVQSFNAFGNSITHSEIVSVSIPSCSTLTPPPEENPTPLPEPTPPPDTAPLAVTITSPEPGSLISGTVQVTADTSNNSAVAGVTLLVDDTEAAPEDTTAPFQFEWDTTTVPDATHRLTLKARPANGTTGAIIP